jgi:hypothetical protein
MTTCLSSECLLTCRCFLWVFVVLWKRVVQQQFSVAWKFYDEGLTHPLLTKPPISVTQATTGKKTSERQGRSLGSRGIRISLSKAKYRRTSEVSEASSILLACFLCVSGHRQLKKIKCDGQWRHWKLCSSGNSEAHLDRGWWLDWCWPHKSTSATCLRLNPPLSSTMLTMFNCCHHGLLRSGVEGTRILRFVFYKNTKQLHINPVH